MNVFEQIVREIGEYDGTAVIDRGRRISYPQLLQSVRSCAARLSGAGLKPGMRAGIIAEDSFEYIALSLAVLSLNAAIVPLSTRASAEELRNMPEKVGINVLLCDAAHR